MNQSNLIIAALYVGFILVGVLIFVSTYKRAPKGVALVRTGYGGQRVVLDGGILICPTLHALVQVGMNTQRVDVDQGGAEALVSADRKSIDVGAGFFIRVKPQVESIANAAQTLGDRTLRPDGFKDFLQRKLVDALRCAVASMTADELQADADALVASVQSLVGQELDKNGLELESLCLTRLKPTPPEHGATALNTQQSRNTPLS